MSREESEFEAKFAAAEADMRSSAAMAEVIRLELRKGSYQMPGETLPYETQAAKIAGALAAAGFGNLEDVVQLVRDLTDPDDCSFDHHGGCQAHGYLSLQPGETCPQQGAKDFVRAATERASGG